MFCANCEIVYDVEDIVKRLKVAEKVLNWTFVDRVRPHLDKHEFWQLEDAVHAFTDALYIALKILAETKDDDEQISRTVRETAINGGARKL